MQTFKGKKIGAKKGYDLLKKKSDALKKAFNDILKKIVQTKKRMGRDFNECLLEMAQANFAAGDFGVTVRDSVKIKTNVRMTISTENVAGVHQPTFNLKGMNEADDDLMIGMTGGGQAINKAKERFQRYLRLLIEIASLQTQFVTIERVIKVTNRRVNALEFVVIPKIEETIKWIEGELDELDREDFYRMKCVQDKKKEAKEKEEAEKKEKMAKMGIAMEERKEEENDIFQENDQIIEDEDEGDVIF